MFDLNIYVFQLKNSNQLNVFSQVNIIFFSVYYYSISDSHQVNSTNIMKLNSRKILPVFAVLSFRVLSYANGQRDPPRIV